MNSILIIRGGAIGDFILTLPAIHAVRDQHPNARLEIMGYHHITELARGRFYACGGRSLEHRSVAMFFAERSELDPDLSAYFRSFDLVVSYLYDPDHIFSSNLQRAGVQRLIVNEGRPTQTSHATEHLSQWLPEANIPSHVRSPCLYPTIDDLMEADILISSARRPLVALHIGSGAQHKNWPTSRYLELAEWLKGLGMGVIVLDGPADFESADSFWKDKRSEGCLRLHALRLPIVAALLQRCEVFVGNDSGISHMAAAVGTSTLAIFGSTDPRCWGPRGKSVIILQRGNAISAIEVEHVKTVLKPLLQKTLKA